MCIAMWRRRLSLAFAFAPLLRCSARPHGPTSRSRSSGVDEPLRANVLAYLSFDRYRK